MLMRHVQPKLPIVALTNGQPFLQAGQRGASPWLGGTLCVHAPLHRFVAP